nr:hypothetical protein Iba_chr01aCG9240 [Ipomoea batatas]
MVPKIVVFGKAVKLEDVGLLRKLIVDIDGSFDSTPFNLPRALANAAGGVEILVDKMAALLEMVDALDAVAPPDLLAEDLGLLDMYPLLPDQVASKYDYRDEFDAKLEIFLSEIRLALVKCDIGYLNTYLKF